MVLFTTERLIAIVGIATILSFIFSYVQGWFNLQIQYFIVALIAICAIVYLIYNKSAKEKDLFKEIERMKPIIKRELGYNPRVDWAAKHSDNKRFSKSGKVIDIQYKGNPAKPVIYLDAKSGGAVLWAPETKGREAPINIPENEPSVKPSGFIVGGKEKVKFEKETKP